MGLTVTGDAMVFVTEFDWGKAYSVGLSKKKDDGTYDRAYFKARFKKDVSLENMTKIDIKNGWLSFDVDKNDPKKKYPYLFIGEFTSDAPEVPQGFEYAQITEDELPF